MEYTMIYGLPALATQGKKGEDLRALSFCHLTTMSKDSEFKSPDFSTPKYKRIFDFCILLFALPVVILLMFFIAIGIKLLSPGPVFYVQRRVGFKGKEFKCYKFRTMKQNSSDSMHQVHVKALIHSNEPMTKIDSLGDPRLILLGAWLRSSGLDELPQLINVLKGEMSLIGPRPCLPYEYEQYQAWHKERCNTLPGLTGLWQVDGKNKTTFNEMINLDIQYVRDRSMILDLKILFKTVLVLQRQIFESPKIFTKIRFRIWELKISTRATKH